MEDRILLDISSAIMWTIVAIVPFIVSIKSIRKEDIMIGIHKLAIGKALILLEQGRSMSYIFDSTYFHYTFLREEKPV